MLAFLHTDHHQFVSSIGRKILRDSITSVERRKRNHVLWHVLYRTARVWAPKVLKLKLARPFPGAEIASYRREIPRMCTAAPPPTWCADIDYATLGAHTTNGVERER